MCDSIVQTLFEQSAFEAWCQFSSWITRPTPIAPSNQLSPERRYCATSGCDADCRLILMRWRRVRFASLNTRCAEKSCHVSFKIVDVGDQLSRRVFAGTETQATIGLVHSDQIDFGIACPSSRECDWSVGNLRSLSGCVLRTVGRQVSPVLCLQRLAIGLPPRQSIAIEDGTHARQQQVRSLLTRTPESVDQVVATATRGCLGKDR